MSSSRTIKSGIAAIGSAGVLLTCSAAPAEFPPLVIYYGLNDSHSRSWAQVTTQGLVGISCFEHTRNTGTLVYRTIEPDGTENVEPVTTGYKLGKSVLLYDAASSPHIFVAVSNDSEQSIVHYYKNNHVWENETVAEFSSEGGKFIYELSADTGPGHSFHLLVLKARSDVDSDDYWFAWLDSNLYHVTNASGSWEQELIRHYNMAYTYDHDIISSSRQDMKVDEAGHVHIVFSEQIAANDDPSRLWYGTNRSGSWAFEIALNFDEGIRDDAGWFPSLCLDGGGRPHISCMYVNRVYTRSPRYCRLLLLSRVGENSWLKDVVAESDDGYYGGDGRVYTGGLSHIVYDSKDVPHVVFADIASSHWDGYNHLNVGNIRYGIRTDGVWDVRTIYRQPLPTYYRHSTEMYGMCLLLSERSDTVRVIGQEMVVDGDDYSCSLVKFSWEEAKEVPEDTIHTFAVEPSYPNPVSSMTSIRYEIPSPERVTVVIYDLVGRRAVVLEDLVREAGRYSVQWDGRNETGRSLANGVYLCRIQAGTDSKTLKILLMK